MIIEVYQSGDGTEQAVRFVSDMGSPINSINGEPAILLEAHQVYFDGSESDLEVLLLGQVFFRYVDEEDEEVYV